MHVTATMNVDRTDEPTVSAGWGYVSISPDGKYGTTIAFSGNDELAGFAHARAWVAQVSEQLRIAEQNYAVKVALRAAEEEGNN